VSASAVPLVSVLVRSLDRPLLAEALASVATQTHGRIEVIVVAANPGHGPVPATAGAHPVRLLQAPQTRPRSLAANVGLDAATGEWLLFLDDDDWLMPDHIARLVAALQAHPRALAAYAGVAMVDADGTPQGQAFDLPFDAVRLMSGNLMPIHAVLFSRQLLAQGCRFDEALDRYEDWDFWLQVAKRTVPVHVPGVSAVYRIHGSSGVHDDAGAQGLSSHAIHAKWLQQSTPRQLGEVMQRVWAYDVTVQRLALVEEVAAARERALADAVQAVGEQVRTLQGLHALHAQLQTEVREQSLAIERRQVTAQLESQVLLRQLVDESAATLTRQLSEQWAEQLVRERERGERLERDLAEERQRSSEQRLVNDALRASFSWRLTGPLRAAVDAIRRVRQRRRH
jgi:hypothetical protein